MNDLLFGLLAIMVGLLLCLRGQWALRILLAVWGAFVGFALGAGLVDAVTDEGFLAGMLGWTVGIVVAALFAAVAYLYYVVGVALSMAAMGFVLGGTIASALGATATWLLVLVGALCGVALALLAVLADLPQLILIVVSSLAGASVLVAGLMLVFGVVGSQEVADAAVRLDDHPWWYAAYAAAVILGIVAQVRQADSVRASVRESWA